jgi:YVTN family beta-propeller protein
VPYSSVRDVVQNSRPRWAADDRSIWGAVAENTGLKPEQWADTRNAVHVLDTIIGRSTLTRLPDGINGRLALSRRYAAVTTLGADGDVTTLVDADPRSRMYRRVVGTVALPALAGGPVPGRPTAGTQSRVTAITPDGTTVFVTSGGQGRITAIDTATRRVVRSVTAPTKLSGAYATVVRLGEPVTDLVAR